MHNVSKAYNWGFANSSKNGKLDIHDNKKWLFYIESQFTYQISNNKPKIIKSTNHWAYAQGNQCLYIIKTT
jgi:hypothetical protein